MSALATRKRKLQLFSVRFAGMRLFSGSFAKTCPRRRARCMHAESIIVGTALRHRYVLLAVVRKLARGSELPIGSDRLRGSARARSFFASGAVDRSRTAYARLL